MNKEETIVNVVALTVGAAAGFTVGYLVQKRKYENWFAEDQKKQDASRKSGVFSTPQGAVKELIGDEYVVQERAMTPEEVSEMLVDAGYPPLNGEDTYEADQDLTEAGILVIDEPSVDPLTHVELDIPANEGFESEFTGEEIVASIWQNAAEREALTVEATANEDQDEMPEADPDKPYIITVDQFMTENKYDDNKVSLMYYQGDDQMVDERDQLFNNYEEFLGAENLQRFGLGSRDRNALYIRNDKKKMDFEIIRDTRTYLEVVHGVKPEKRISPRKMRDDDQ